MTYHDMNPVSKPHTNAILGGRPATNSETSVKNGTIGGLPITVTHDNQQTVSIWKCGSIFHRVRFLFHGEITLTVLGEKHPPVSLSVGDAITANPEA